MNAKDKPPIEVEEKTPQDPKRQQEIRALIELENKQLALLRDLVESGECPSYLVDQMIDLGMLAQADDVLPCKQDGRWYHPGDWYSELERYREHLENPKPPPPEPMGFLERGKWEKSTRLPTTGQYACPVQSRACGWDEEDPVPCVEARVAQARSRSYKDDPQKQQRLSDPKDPVNALQLRPCRVLATLLYDEIFVVIARRKREAEERRWQWTGKPRA